MPDPDPLRPKTWRVPSKAPPGRPKTIMNNLRAFKTVVLCKGFGKKQLQLFLRVSVNVVYCIFCFSGERIFRIGSLRYKMDSSRRTLVRLPGTFFHFIVFLFIHPYFSLPIVFVSWNPWIILSSAFLTKLLGCSGRW